MAEYPAAVHSTRPPVHPGELIREILEETLDLPISEAARRLHVSRQSLHAVLSGRAAVTPDMALRIGKLFGRNPALWLNMQQAYDLWHGERNLADILEKIETTQPPGRA